MTTDSKSQPHKTTWITALILALIGIITSLYSINHHMELKSKGHTEAACNISSAINCDAVAASKYSEMLGIPLGVWGLGYFLAMAILAGTLATNHKSSKEHEPAWLILVGLGVVTSLGLAAISLGILNKVCLVCLIVYAITLAQGVLAWQLWSKRRLFIDFSLKTLIAGLSTAAIAAAVSVVGFNMIRPTAQLPSELQDLPGKHDGIAALPQLATNSVDIAINKSAYSGLGEDFRKGPDDAKIVIVEFADYMCPACGQTAPELEELHRQLGDSAQFVFKNFPLSNLCNSGVESNMHPYSCDIAKLARCAGMNGKFWEYHRKAFEEQSRASLEKAREWGRSVGLTDAQMNQCLESKDILAKIRDDVDIANKAGVNATPTIFINGRKYMGERTTSKLRAVIESI